MLPTVAGQCARRNEHVPDVSFWSAILADCRGSASSGRRAHQVMLDRKGFSPIKDRAHSPFGHVSGACSRVLGSIGQTGDMVLRCTVLS